MWASKVTNDIRLVEGRDKEKRYLQDATTNGILDVDLVQAIKNDWQPESLLDRHINRVKDKVAEAQAAIAQATPQDVERIKTLQTRWKESTDGMYLTFIGLPDARIQSMSPAGPPATELTHTAVTLGVVLDESLQSSVATQYVHARHHSPNISALRWERGNDDATPWPGQPAEEVEVLRPDGCLSALCNYGNEECLICVVRADSHNVLTEQPLHAAHTVL